MTNHFYFWFSLSQVPSWAKLPAFYLLDAISKNFFDPYARIFAPFVVSLFLQTYSQVDEPTRAKMEEMVLTWRTGSPSRFELFGAQHQLSIEQGIWGDGGSGHVSFISFFKVINIIDDNYLVERQSDNESPSPQRTSVCARPEGACISSQPIRPKRTKPHRHTATGGTLPIRSCMHP